MLTIKGLHSGYGAVRVLHGVDLTVGEGELVAVIGSNGAGKTTLLRTISGLLRPRSGMIVFDGRDLLRLSPDEIVKAGVVHVPEGRMVLNRMTVLENLQLGAFVRTDTREIQRDLDNVLEIFPRLHERLGQYAGTLSGGEQQMLAIGRGLMGKPSLLMLDEPSLGVAPIVVDAIYEAIEAVRRRGVTILLVEQNAQRALAVAARAYALELGKVSVSGSGDELLKDDRVRQAYLGV
jgi:branched-chain amino acid transport system ATP-binding protein